MIEQFKDDVLIHIQIKPQIITYLVMICGFVIIGYLINCQRQVLYNSLVLVIFFSLHCDLVNDYNIIRFR